jgi:hypothetical protein
VDDFSDQSVIHAKESLGASSRCIDVVGDGLEERHVGILVSRLGVESDAFVAAVLTSLAKDSSHHHKLAYALAEGSTMS